MKQWCQWASCRNPATVEEDNYWHCRPHLYEHRRMREEDANNGRRVSGVRPACGSHAGFNGHWKRSETPCEPCATAEREYQRNRHHGRKATSSTSGDAA